jgi:hypothetical protein
MISSHPISLSTTESYIKSLIGTFICGRCSFYDKDDPATWDDEMFLQFASAWVTLLLATNHGSSRYNTARLLSCWRVLCPDIIHGR